jgi:hypothetical protein
MAMQAQGQRDLAWSEGNKAAIARAQKKPAAYRAPSYSNHPQAWMG